MANEHTTPVATPTESPKKQTIEVIAILAMALLGFSLLGISAVTNAHNEMTKQLQLHQSGEIDALKRDVSAMNEQNKRMADALFNNSKHTGQISTDLQDLEKKVLVLTITQKVKP